MNSDHPPAEESPEDSKDGAPRPNPSQSPNRIPLAPKQPFPISPPSTPTSGEPAKSEESPAAPSLTEQPTPGIPKSFPKPPEKAANPAVPSAPSKEAPPLVVEQPSPSTPPKKPLVENSFPHLKPLEQATGKKEALEKEEPMRREEPIKKEEPMRKEEPIIPATPPPPAIEESAVAQPAKPARLLSLDALRGFDMFWIVGGAALLRAIAHWSGSPPFIANATEQTIHSPWIGFTLYDLIFPLFIFMSGMTIPYAITGKIAKGTLSIPGAYFRVLRRFILLTAVGLSFTFLSFDPTQFRIPGVLQLIAGAYLIAGLIAIHRPAKSQFVWAFGILIGYWLALTFIPIPGKGPGQFTPGGSLAGYLDRTLVPGYLYMGVFDPEGPIRFLPAAAMALLGSVTGSFLRSQEKATHGNVLKLIVAGLIALGLGWIWGLTFPIIKPLWTSSFVLVCAGCSLLLLSFFYLIIDVWKQRWFAFPWIPLGMNALTIYVLTHFVNFRTISENILSGYAGTLAEHPAEFTLALGTIILEWLLLFYLFRKKTFLRL